MIMKGFIIKIIMVSIASILGGADGYLKIPFTYGLSKDELIKYPIKISFESSQTWSWEASDTLNLFNLKVPLNIHQNQSSEKIITIGLKYPSEFMHALSSTLKIQQDQIEFGKDEYLELRINEHNYVESHDVFMMNEAYDVRVVNNYGPKILIKNQICNLIDSQMVYFNQFLIRQILTGINDQNKITYTFNDGENTITLNGNLHNFPKITLMKDKSLFNVRVNIKDNKIHYIPTNGNREVATLIGVNALVQFGKFQVREYGIVFKRTSIMYILFLFLGYFFLFTLGMILFCRSNLFSSMKFVRNILKWAIMKDNQARVEVLRTQLQ